MASKLASLLNRLRSNDPSLPDMSLAPRRRLFGLLSRPARSAAPIAAMTPRKPPKTGSAPIIIGTLHKLYDLSRNPLGGRPNILLTGELVLASDNPAAADPPQCVRQPDRIVTNLLGGKNPSASTLRVWVHENVFQVKAQLPRYRFVLAIDQYIQYGRRHKNLQCLVTGCPTPGGTIVHIYHFKAGQLAAMEERNLGPADGHRFPTDYRQLIESLLRNGTRALSIVAPLPPVEVEGAHYVDGAPFAKLTYLPIEGGADERRIKGRLAPFAVAGLGALGYAAAVVVPYAEYDDALTQFRRTSAALPQNTSFGASQLKTMQQRRFALEESRPQESAARFLTRVAEAAARQNALITHIHLRFSQDTDGKGGNTSGTPDLAFTIQIPRQPGDPYSIVKPILERLSAALNLKLHLAINGGYTPETKDGTPTMLFRIEVDSLTLGAAS